MMHMRVFFKPASKSAKPLQFKTLSLAQTRTSPFQVKPYGEYNGSDTPTLGYTIPRSIGGEDAVMLNSMGCGSKVILSGVNGNVIMSGCGDDNPDDER